MFNIYNNNWPKVERALIVFSNVDYEDPIFVWYTRGGYIEQDAVDGCLTVSALSSDHPSPNHGIWVWEGKFDVLDDIYDSMEGFGVWRVPTSEEWSSIISNKNPWSK